MMAIRADRICDKIWRSGSHTEFVRLLLSDNKSIRVLTNNFAIRMADQSGRTQEVVRYYWLIIGLIKRRQ
jgi:hypothetical protein